MPRPKPLKIAMASSPVAPLGHGSCGGVTRSVEVTIKALHLLQNHVTLIAPADSKLDTAPDHYIAVRGAAQPTLANMTIQDVYPIVPDSLLGSMWQTLHDLEVCGHFDLVLNMAHDWLPFYLTSFLSTPVIHIVNMGNVCEATTTEIRRVSRSCPGRIGLLSRAQADDLGDINGPVYVASGLDLSLYDFNGNKDGPLVWAGRISPEKGLEDILRIADALGEPVAIAGPVSDKTYWDRLQCEFSQAIDYHGLLNQQALQHLLGTGRACLQTPKWQEALGLVTLEAMACGTPVIAYDRGANRELILDGETGYLIPGDNTDKAVQAVEQIDAISREKCRSHVEENFSLASYAERLSKWMSSVVSGTAGKDKTL